LWHSAARGVTRRAAANADRRPQVGGASPVTDENWQRRHVVVLLRHRSSWRRRASRESLSIFATSSALMSCAPKVEQCDVVVLHTAPHVDETMTARSVRRALK
jgi:hypothetical protein